MGSSDLLPPLLLLLSLCCSCLGQNTFMMVAPNILRVGSQENILYLESDMQGQVTISVRRYLERSTLYEAKETLVGNQALHRIKLNPNDFSDNVKGNRFVVVKAQISGQVLKTVVLLSFQSGYIFLQTDKPIYNPGEDLQYRVFVTNLEAKAMDGVISVTLKNSDGILISQTPMGLKVMSGHHTGTFTLPDIVKDGTWTLEAELQGETNKVFNTTFDVKKHVLPTFEVSLKSNKRFFHVEDTELTVDIDVKYFAAHDAAVEGYAYVTFGYVEDKSRIQFTTSIQRLTLQNGRATAKLTTADIETTIVKQQETQKKKNVRAILGRSIYARATVFTSTGSDIVTGELTGIKVVESPYIIQFTQSSMYFKPGMPFSLYVYLTDTSGSPVEGIDIEHGNLKQKTDGYGIVVIDINTVQTDLSKQVEVKTADLNLKPSHQAVKVITLEVFETKRIKEYLHLSVNKRVIKKDEGLRVTLHTRHADQKNLFRDGFISYMVVSKGKIIEVGRWLTGRNQLIEKTLRVSPDMLPSFRLLCFYTMPGQIKEVVADSIWVDVEDECMGKLELSIEKGNTRQVYKPKEVFTVVVNGDPGAKVGLVVVDKAAYALSKEGILTQNKIWDEVERGDIGCTRGGGKNNMAIFSDAGLLFKSNLEKTPPRQSVSCNVETPRRKRRAESLQQAKEELAKRYAEGTLEKRCCRDGLMNFPLDYSCEKRSTFITEGQTCVDTFLRCCRGIQEDKKRFSTTELVHARSDEETYIEEDIHPRSKFAVSWMWSTITLSGKTNDLGFVKFTNDKDVLRDSITSWLVLGTSTSNTRGVCVAKPVEMIVEKKFSVDLRMPYAVVTRERVEIKVVINNYLDEDITELIMTVKGSEDLCLPKSEKGTYKLRGLAVDRNSQKVLYVTVIPKRPGEHHITVKVYNFDGAKDGVEKSLRVMPAGVEESKLNKVILEPSDNIFNGRQMDDVTIDLPNMLPDFKPTSTITLQGDRLANTVWNSIGGAVLKKLIRMPGGCVEQNLAAMTPTIIAVHYMDNANAWEEVGVDKRVKALKSALRGYHNHLVYRRSDDTYPTYQIENRPSTWVTAYTAKVFAMMYEFENGVDIDRVCKPLNFLIGKQNSEGNFQELAAISSQWLAGQLSNVGGIDLTAFVLIAMDEAYGICKDGVKDLHGAMQKAADQINKKLPSQSSPYTVAISSYALARFNKGSEIDHETIMKSNLIKHLERTRTGTHWGGTDDKGVEATGYALLALVTLGELQKAKPVSDWLVARGSRTGSFGNTQCTIVVFQALALYRQKSPPPPSNDISVSLSLTSPVRTDKSSKLTWKLDQNSNFLSRSERIPQLTKFSYEAKGTGRATLLVLSKYYRMILEEKLVCNGFKMDTKIEKLDKKDKKGPAGVIGVYQLTVCVRPLQETDKRMTILDISLPSGFVPDYNDLQQMMTRTDSLISYYELDKELSQQGSLIIHIYKISGESDHCVPVTLYQEFDVKLLQPAFLKVYSYYNPDQNCTQSYEPFLNTSEVDTICNKDGCACIDQDCPSLKTGSLTKEDRVWEACAGTNPVYKIKVESLESGSAQTTYKMEIQHVYKEGDDSNVQPGQKVDFYAHRSCQKSLGLRKGQELMIINNPKDLIKKADDRYSYVISGETWLEDFSVSGGEQKKFLDEMETSGCST